MKDEKRKANAKTVAQRQADFVERNRKLDRVRRPYYATQFEHEELKKRLKELRSE